MKKLLARLTTAFGTAASIFCLSTALASAHVVVTPKAAQTAQETLFSLSVPNERQSGMTQLKLTIPAGVLEVSPTVAPGWTITTEKSGDNVSAITWSGGTIPAGQREDFTFQAQTPEKAGELQWKAYQTYVDGTNVSWDQKPTANAPDNDSARSGPYSVTTVSDTAPAAANGASSQNSAAMSAALGLSLLALIASIVALVRRR